MKSDKKKDTTYLLPRPPCRVQCVLAQNADVGVILRRGPSEWVQVIRWDTSRDVFEPGQWFKGRIFPEGLELSPNGQLMMYTAQKFTWEKRFIHDDPWAWTAISKPPYLTALAFWPMGSTLYSGGYFLSDTKVALFIDNDPPVTAPIEVIQYKELAAAEETFPSAPDRNGWLLEPDGFNQRISSYLRGQIKFVYVKRIDTLNADLLMIWVNYRDSYALRHSKGLLRLDGVEWADRDRNGRLVLARSGTIAAGTLNSEGHLDATVLADFNDAKPNPQPSPDWAKTW